MIKEFDNYFDLEVGKSYYIGLRGGDDFACMVRKLGDIIQIFNLTFTLKPLKQQRLRKVRYEAIDDVRCVNASTTLATLEDLYKGNEDNG